MTAVGNEHEHRCRVHGSGNVGHGDEDEVATTGGEMASERQDGRGVQLGPRVFGGDAAVVEVAAPT